MKKRYKGLLLAVLVVLVLAEEVLKRRPALIEKGYSQTVYPTLSQGMNRVSGVFPFSLFEMMFCGVLIGVAFLTLMVIRRLWNRTGLKVHPQRALYFGVLAVLGGVLLFNTLWGLNYYREPLANRLGITMRQHSVSELKTVCKKLIEESNLLSVKVNRNSDEVMAVSGSRDAVLKRTAIGYREAGLKYPIFRTVYGYPKQVLFSDTMAWIGISGIYSPFTAEPNVNALLPASTLPFTAMHEMGHLYGFAREDEANFVAWLTCRMHPDTDYQYSGALMGTIYAMNALYESDPAAWSQLKKTYSPLVNADMKANNAFWKRYEGPAERIHNRINDGYLKANGQLEGVRSYGRMVDLLLEYELRE